MRSCARTQGCDALCTNFVPITVETKRCNRIEYTSPNEFPAWSWTPKWREGWGVVRDEQVNTLSFFVVADSFLWCFTNSDKQIMSDFCNIKNTFLTFSPCFCSSPPARHWLCWHEVTAHLIKWEIPVKCEIDPASVLTLPVYNWALLPLVSLAGNDQSPQGVRYGKGRRLGLVFNWWI